MDFLFFALLIAAIPFVLPIASWVSARRTRGLVEDLAATLDEQGRTIESLKEQLTQLRRQVTEAPRTQAEDRRAAAPAPSVATPSVRPAAPPAPSVPAPVLPPSRPAAEKPAAPAPLPAPGRIVEPPSVRVSMERSVPPRPSIPPAAPAPIAASATGGATMSGTAAALPPRPPRTPPPPVPPEPPAPAFDWESLVGVKLFSGIAGIALVFAAVYFLKYSVEHGWLQPPVRVIIGITVALTLLVVCELKAARRYPSTANALDAAAIAILFSTFFAAHELWHLIPSSVTFILLGVVTALAVLLSIRRESLFIAVLGLLGGFATPVLLSTGQNQPIPLFAYLTLLNIGLAWVAYRQTWPVLTTMTLVLTTLYQWGWVFKFLDRSQLTLAMAIFLLFPLTSLTGLILSKRRMTGDAPTGADRTFERTAMFAAVVPLFFAVYVSAVPSYGDRPGLLFGFLLLVDAGLLAVALARRQGILHAAGALTTLVVMASWLGLSYTAAGATTALVFAAVFVTFFALAPVLAERVGRDARGGGRSRRVRGAAAAVRTGGAGADRAGVCLAPGPVRHASRARAVDRVAGRCHGARPALLLGGVLRHRDPGVLVLRAPHDRTAEDGGRDLHGLRDRRHGDPDRRAAYRPRVAARVGQRRRAHREPCAAPVPVARIDRAGGAVGAGAAAGDHQRRALRGKRVRRAAAGIGRRKPALVVRTRRLVAARRQRGWHAALAGGADRPLVDHDGRSCVGVGTGSARSERACPERRRRAGTAGRDHLPRGDVPRAHRAPVRAVRGDHVQRVARAVAVAGDARRADPGHEHVVAHHARAGAACRRRHRRGRRHRDVDECDRCGVGAGGARRRGHRQRLRARVDRDCPRPRRGGCGRHAALSRRAHGHHRDRRRRLAAISRDRRHARRQSRGAARADVDAPLAAGRALGCAAGRLCRRRAVGGRRSARGMDAPAGARLRDVRRVHRVSDRRRPPRPRRAGSVSGGGARQRDVLLRGACRARRRRLHLDGRRAAGLRRGRDGAPAPAVAADRAGRRTRSRAPGARRRLGARLRHRGDPAAAPAPVDHDRVGARRDRAGLAVSGKSRIEGCSIPRSGCWARCSCASR